MAGHQRPRAEPARRHRRPGPGASDRRLGQGGRRGDPAGSRRADRPAIDAQGRDRMEQLRHRRRRQRQVRAAGRRIGHPQPGDGSRRVAHRRDLEQQRPGVRGQPQRPGGDPDRDHRHPGRLRRLDPGHQGRRLHGRPLPVRRRRRDHPQPGPHPQWAGRRHRPDRRTGVQRRADQRAAGPGGAGLGPGGDPGPVGRRLPATGPARRRGGRGGPRAGRQQRPHRGGRRAGDPAGRHRARRGPPAGQHVGGDRRQERVRARWLGAAGRGRGSIRPGLRPDRRLRRSRRRTGGRDRGRGVPGRRQPAGHGRPAWRAGAGRRHVPGRSAGKPSHGGGRPSLHHRFRRSAVPGGGADHHHRRGLAHRRVRRRRQRRGRPVEQRTHRPARRDPGARRGGGGLVQGAAVDRSGQGERGARRRAAAGPPGPRRARRLWRRLLFRPRRLCGLHQHPRQDPGGGRAQRRRRRHPAGQQFGDVERGRLRQRRPRGRHHHQFRRQRVPGRRLRPGGRRPDDRSQRHRGARRGRRRAQRRPGGHLHVFRPDSDHRQRHRDHGRGRRRHQRPAGRHPDRRDRRGEHHPGQRRAIDEPYLGPDEPGGHRERDPDPERPDPGDHHRRPGLQRAHDQLDQRGVQRPDGLQRLGDHLHREQRADALWRARQRLQPDPPGAGHGPGLAAVHPRLRRRGPDLRRQPAHRLGNSARRRHPGGHPDRRFGHRQRTRLHRHPRGLRRDLLGHRDLRLRLRDKGLFHRPARGRRHPAHHAQGADPHGERRQLRVRLADQRGEPGGDHQQRHGGAGGNAVERRIGDPGRIGRGLRLRQHDGRGQPHLHPGQPGGNQRRQLFAGPQRDHQRGPDHQPEAAELHDPGRLLDLRDPGHAHQHHRHRPGGFGRGDGRRAHRDQERGLHYPVGHHQGGGLCDLPGLAGRGGRGQLQHRHQRQHDRGPDGGGQAAELLGGQRLLDLRGPGDGGGRQPDRGGGDRRRVRRGAGADRVHAGHPGRAHRRRNLHRDRQRPLRRGRGQLHPDRRRADQRDPDHLGQADKLQRHRRQPDLRRAGERAEPDRRTRRRHGQRLCRRRRLDGDLGPPRRRDLRLRHPRERRQPQLHPRGPDRGGLRQLFHRSQFGDDGPAHGGGQVPDLRALAPEHDLRHARRARRGADRRPSAPTMSRGRWSPTAAA
ncbi:MAG: hypothetical protein WDN45_10230 [Caulobacteraceae bacterium]